MCLTLVLLKLLDNGGYLCSCTYSLFFFFLYPQCEQKKHLDELITQGIENGMMVNRSDLRAARTHVGQKVGTKLNFIVCSL